MLKQFAIAAVFGLIASPAFAGPSGHSSFSPGDTHRVSRPHARATVQVRSPYALTGEQPTRRVLVWKDTAGGNGVRHSIPMWVSR